MEELRVYWAPGCSSCLRMKEFLTRHGVSFKSINVFENPSALHELVKLGIRSVPIAVRGNDWSDGQVLGDLARLAEIPLSQESLSPVELVKRQDVFLGKALALVAQLPGSEVEATLPGSPRSNLQLGAHICCIVEIFLDALEKGRSVEAVDYATYPDVHTIAELLAYGTSVQNRFRAWWANAEGKTDFTAPANVYFRATLHEFFERSVWHSGQHARQLQAVIEGLGIKPTNPITKSDLAGLPMPETVYEMPEFAKPDSASSSSTPVKVDLRSKWS
jgi:glutaredoxin